jgi:hypothetical protein
MGLSASLLLSPLSNTQPALSQAQNQAQSQAQKTAPTSTNKKPGTSKAQVVPRSNMTLHGHINAFGTACVSSGVIPLSTQLPTTIEEVQKGSAAFFAGLVKGDRILEATIDPQKFSLKIERQGHIYLATMRAQMDDSQNQSSNHGNPDTMAEILRSYHIRLIVDHSGSMYRPIGSSDKLRWTWVQDEVARFCSAVQRQAGSTFDIYLFNESVEANQNQSAEQIKRILDNAVTTGNTNLPAALNQATAASDRPLLIILITDGQAVSSKQNGAILVRNLNLSPNLRHSRIVFLQAGYSTEGSNFIASLNDELAERGMGQGAYSVLFEEASQRGILGAIEPYLRRGPAGTLR